MRLRRYKPEIAHCPLPESVAFGPWPLRASMFLDLAHSAPLLSSRPSATKKLWLCFDGRTTGTWALWSAWTPAYAHADNEASVTEIWQRVAEDYSLWDLDVTTIQPASLAQNDTAIICIGGSYSDWYGSSSGGVAFIGGYSGFSTNQNTGFVFSNNLAGANLAETTKNVAEATSHEAGHLFGLRHQAVYSGETLITQYNQGGGGWAPIMGNSYAAVRSTWHNGPNDNGWNQYQNDLAVISAKNFGLRTDDYANSVETAGALTVTDGAFSVSGVLQEDDIDAWEFTCAGGEINATLSGGVGANTNLILELRNAAGDLIAIAAPSDSFNATVTETVSAGDYVLLAYPSEDYGWLGQYTLSGTVPLVGSGIIRSGRLFRRSA